MLLELLGLGPQSVTDLARQLQLTQKQLATELRHLIQSLKNAPERVVVHPARCGKCGFAFGTDKLTRPGKCPRCRETRVSPPAVEIG